MLVNTVHQLHAWSAPGIASCHITFCIHHCLTYLQLFKKIYNNLTHLPILYHSTHDKIFIMFPTFIIQILLTSFTVHKVLLREK